MEVVLFATGLGFLVGMLGTGLGGLSALIIPDLSPGHQGKLVGFSGGVMIGIVIWDLAPEAYALGPTYGLGGFLAGALFVLLLKSSVGKGKVKSDQTGGTENDMEATRLRFTRTAVLLSVGIGVHNLPEGVAVGTVFAENPYSPLWKQLALLMAVHNIPEGLAIATSLRLGGAGWPIVATALFVTEMPMVVGALLGGFLGYFSQVMSASALGFAGGAMTILAGGELFPLAHEIGGLRSALIGMAVGLLTAWVLAGVFS